MSIDNVHRTNRVIVDRIPNEAATWGLSRARANDIVAEMLAAIPEAAERAADETPGLPPEIRRIVTAQLDRLRATTA